MVESSFNSDYYEDDQNKKSFLSKIKLVIGATSLVFSFIIFFSLLSYFFTGFDDQSLINPGVSFSTFGEEARNWLGVFGAFIGHYFIYVLFGVSSFILVPFLLIISFQFLFNIKLYSLGKTFIVSIFSIIWISTSMGFFLNIFPDSFILRNYTGGIGYGLAILLDNLLGYSSILILLLSLFIFVVFYFDLYSFSFISSTKLNSSKDFDTTDTETSEDTIIADDFEEEVGNNIVEEEEIKIDNAEKIEEIKDIKINKEDSEEDDLELKVEETLDEKTSSAKIGTVYDPELDLSNYKYPKVDLLNESTREKIQVTKDELTSNKNRIIETLKNFKIDIAKIKATIGPTVTLYEIVPEAGVKISKIKNLEDDIALSLSALGIRIIAPIPGKGTIGIEVPNKNREVVSLRSVMRTEKFIKNDFELPLILGKTISNEVFLADLTKMPHVLVAGATGQGKSVGLNVMLSSLLFKKHPSSLKFVLIDPKKVELSLFNKIERHFLAKLPDAEEPIITETKKVVHTLNSLCTEMDVRYNLLKDAQARNLKEYNKKFINRKLNPKEGHRYLPYIV